MTDAEAMARAAEIAARGYPAPNPHVGCVLVRGGEVVGEGWHDHAGGLHAETAALAVAGERARGATAFVTLEPCDHQGRQPPCSLALIAAGVARVVYAVPDPNPVAAGGAARLRAAGIPVEIQPSGAAEAVNERWLTAVRRGWPHVTVKAALSLDGRIALPSGESRWITGEEARGQGRALRAECGAVLVGRGTVEADDPALTHRTPGAANPAVRIVLDPRKRLRGTERVFDGDAPTLWVDAPFSLPDLLRDLYAKGITGLLVEGGGRTIASFVTAGRVDRYELFLAPKILGDGPSWVGGLGLPALAVAPDLRVTRVTPVGRDLRITAVPAEGNRTPADPSERM